jgi:hypothetical protein
MADEIRLIDGNVFVTFDVFAFFKLGDSVDQHKRVTVRQLLEDAVNVHHDKFSFFDFNCILIIVYFL